jgi:hypothetical protein
MIRACMGWDFIKEKAFESSVTVWTEEIFLQIFERMRQSDGLFERIKMLI